MNKKTDFVHLRFHSEYSLMDSCCSLSSVKKECLKKGFSSLAITDEANISGIIKFYKECVKKEDKDGNKLDYVKPILGSMIYLSDDMNKHVENDHMPVILLVKNNSGLDDLKKISNISYIDGFNEIGKKPRIDLEFLDQYKENLIMIATDLNGPVQRLLRRRKEKEALEKASILKDMFVKDLYLEVQNNGQADQELVNRGIMNISKELGIKVVATNDVRYYDKNHYKAHLVLQALDQRKTIKSRNFTAIKTNQRYLKTYEEMQEAFKDFPKEVLTNTIEVDEKCNVSMTFGGMRLPEYKLPDGFDSDWDYLKHLAFKGLKEKNLHNKKEYIDRLKEELFDVKKANETKGYNYARYFLIVWDYANYAQTVGGRVGIGRGSACGSLLLYALKVTNIDPIKYSLHWWRFITADKHYYINENCFI